jgi:hypothetical protein
MNATRAEVLISRMIDGEAGTDDWQEFTTLAAGAPELWRELAEAQRQHTLLDAALAETINVAATIDLPDLSDADKHLAAQHVPLQQRFVAWVGWAVAAALAVALWSGIQPSANTGGPISGNSEGNTAPLVPQQAGLLANLAPAEILQAYLDRGKDEGQVLGELPDKVLLETRANPQGDGYEVLFIRTILERASVPELYEFGSQDESGRPVLAKYQGRKPRPL